MKITALGVNSAFATGTFHQAVSADQVKEIFLKFQQDQDFHALPEDYITEEIKKISKRMYEPKWQSNFLVEFDTVGKRGKSPYRLLVDAGADVRHSLKNIGLSSADIDGVYISHPHNDHIGGIEYLGLTMLFNPFYSPSKKEWLGDQFIVDKLFLEQEWWPRPPESSRPDLYIHRKVLEPLKRAVSPGLDTMQGVPDVNIETYFDIHLIGKQNTGETLTHKFHDGDGFWKMKPLFAMHVISSSEEMASYGISLEHSSGYNVLMPTDTQHMMPPQLEAHYKRAHRIYMDCETSDFPSGVHPHLNDLMHRMSSDVQKKCLLYHYDKDPEVPEDMFCGILKAGDFHIYP
ncbi:MBL fold metallo-hydrolase [Desulfobacterales bacterium HSG17]|nr:MBL fold metallo-hydrolase [Desulfobacterales bacterium HSG17]